jgi:zinc protease
VVVAKNCQELKKKILAGEPSPMTYNSPKPGEVLEEDKIVERWKIELRPERIQVVPLETVFE